MSNNKRIGKFRCSASLFAGLALAMALPQAQADAVAAQVYIIAPADGATVSSPVTVQFGLRGMGVAPAGVDKANTGHHHLLIDAGQVTKGQPIPSDDHHKHFGGGQTEATLPLSPGTHTLQLVLGDKDHVPVDGMVSKPITITVK